MVREVESIKLVIVVVPVQLIRVSMLRYQGTRQCMDSPRSRATSYRTNRGHTYQEHTLILSEGRDEQQHTNTIRLLAHPITEQILDLALLSSKAEKG